MSALEDLKKKFPQFEVTFIPREVKEAEKDAQYAGLVLEHTLAVVTEPMQRLIEDLKQYEESHPELVAILTFRAKEGRYSDFHRNAFSMPKLTLMENAKKLPKIVEGVLQGRYDD